MAMKSFLSLGHDRFKRIFRSVRFSCTSSVARLLRGPKTVSMRRSQGFRPLTLRAILSHAGHGFGSGDVVQGSLLLKSSTRHIVFKRCTANFYMDSGTCAVKEIECNAARCFVVRFQTWVEELERWPNAVARHVSRLFCKARPVYESSAYRWRHVGSRGL